VGTILEVFNYWLLKHRLEKGPGIVVGKGAWLLKENLVYGVGRKEKRRGIKLSREMPTGMGDRSEGGHRCHSLTELGPVNYHRSQKITRGTVPLWWVEEKSSSEQNLTEQTVD